MVPYMSIEQDLLARMLEQLKELLVKVRTLREKRQFADASRLVGDSYKSLFGLDRRFLQMMEPAQVAGILGRPEKLRAFAQVMAEEADLLRQQGDVASAAAGARWTVGIVEAGKLPQDELGTRTLMARLRTLANLVPA
jgi:hypothetical protein